MVKVIVWHFRLLNIENYLGFDLKDGLCKIFGNRFWGLKYKFDFDLFGISKLNFLAGMNGTKIFLEA